MGMYYLHRAGESTGPYAPGRIAQMIDAGEIGDDTLACAHGSEEWIPAHLVAERPERVRPRAARAFPKVSSRPFQWIAGLTILLGLVLLFSWVWVVGLILLVIGLALNRPRFHCGSCGNRVEKISALCTTCRSPLLPWRFRDAVRESRVALALLGIGLAFLLVGWVIVRFL